MEETRKEKICRIWDEIHGNNVPIFYWKNDFRSRYFYDWINNLIRTEDGFAVQIDAEDSQITKTYILDLIYKLEEQIIIHYRDKEHIDICLPD